MNSFGNDEVQRHANDQESVRAWVEEWSQSEDNPVLFCKFKDEPAPDGMHLENDEFMMIIQSSFPKLNSN